MKCGVVLALTVACVCHVLSAPAPVANGTNQDNKGNKPDVPVEQLEKLKSNGEIANSSKGLPPAGTEHVEYHSLDAVKANGELVSRIEQHATADAVPGEKPRLHAHLQYDVPSEGVYREVVQEGDKVEVHDTAAPTSVAAGAATSNADEKVYHGAARLAGGVPPATPHMAVRRAFTAEIPKETNINLEHMSPYSIQYTPLDMAEYVFWTGDERGVTAAIEEFLQEGMMTKEEAISFLQEIKISIESLRAHYAQDKLRNSLMEQAKEAYQYRMQSLPSLSIGSPAEYSRVAPSKSWELGNNIPQVPVSPFDYRQEPIKRNYDPMLQTNMMSTSDYDRDGPVITEDEYEEMMDKLKAADNLYTEYTLEEIIYQLAKMMFSQSLTREPRSARAALQRFMTFLELEAERGHITRTIEKKVLDVMMSALSDTVSEHGEHTRDLVTSQGNRLMQHFLESSVAEPSMSRAILSSYKDELLKGPMHKFAFPERN